MFKHNCPTSPKTQLFKEANSPKKMVETIEAEDHVFKGLCPQNSTFLSAGSVFFLFKNNVMSQRPKYKILICVSCFLPVMTNQNQEEVGFYIKFVNKGG